MKFRGVRRERLPSHPTVVAGLLGLVLVASLLAFGAGAGTSQESVTLEIIDEQDPDGDGYVSSFTVDVRRGHAATGRSAPSEYLRLSVGGVVVREVELTDPTASTVPLPWDTFRAHDRGEFTVRVTLVERGTGLLGGDSRIATETRVVRIEPGREEDVVLASASRERSVVGAPVELVTNRPVTWETRSVPTDGSARLRAADGTVTVQPDTPGRYEFVASATADRSRTATVVLRVTPDENRALVERYAPTLSFADDTSYWPTRFETAVYQSSLVGRSGVVVADPTLADLRDAPSDSYLRLDRGASELASPGTYPEHRYGYPATVYASVHETTFRGESYTAVTYWLFYVYDPKVSGPLSLVAHQADVETVTVLVDGGRPRWVGVSQHYGGELREWSKTPREGTHPVVYPAVGSHANFLYDTSRSDGAGFLAQAQYLSPSIDDGRILPNADAYPDRTGSDVVWRHVGSADEQYELVPLTGDEAWASYRGSFRAQRGGTVVPQRDARWTNPGAWMEEVPLPDEAQRSATVGVDGLSVDAEGPKIEVTVTNTGPTPTDVTVTLLATDEDGDRSVLGSETVPLGTQQSRPVTVGGRLPDDGRQWDIRVSVSSYPPGVATAEDRLASDSLPRSVGRVAGTIVPLRATLIADEIVLDDDGTVVVVESAATTAGGFLVVHDERILSGGQASTYGVSRYLPPGPARGVTVPLDVRPDGPGDVLVVAYLDVDGDGSYDREIDRPYLDPSGRPALTYVYLRATARSGPTEARSESSFRGSANAQSPARYSAGNSTSSGAGIQK